MAPRKSPPISPASTKTTSPPPPATLSLAELYHSDTESRVACKVSHWIETLPDDDRAWLDNQIQVEDNLTRLWKACKRAGLSCARSTFQVYVVSVRGEER